MKRPLKYWNSRWEKWNSIKKERTSAFIAYSENISEYKFNAKQQCSSYFKGNYIEKGAFKMYK